MEDFAKIKSVDGYEIIVDKEDLARLSVHKWKVSFEGPRRYAVTVKAPLLRIHRLVMRAKPGQIVDHINGDCLDNRKQNLRFCSNAENAKNRRISSNNKVGFKGVYWDKRLKKFSAIIYFDGKRKPCSAK